MGGASSTEQKTPFASEQEALDAGKTQEEINNWKKENIKSTKPQKYGYVFGYFDMKDPKEFKTVYSPMAEPTLEPYGGKFVVKAPLKDAKQFGKTGMVAFVLQFESFEKATAWFTGPEYAGVIKKRDEVADFRMAVVEGGAINSGAGLCLGFFDMKDPKEFKTVYSPMAEPTLDNYGGKFIMKQPLVPKIAKMMGKPETKTFGDPGMMAFALQFDNIEKAEGWFTGPEYAKVLTKRDEVADFRMVVVKAL